MTFDEDEEPNRADGPASNSLDAAARETLPSPLVSTEVDLRDFGYMPLNVVQLRDSEFVVMASAEEFRAAVLLWCASWHQEPASSLPDDDRILAHLAGFGRNVPGWMEVKAGTLSDFIKCSDGRLYHPVIARKAIEAFEKKRSQRQRTEAATAAASERRRNGVRNGDQEKGMESKGIEKKGESIIAAPPARHSNSMILWSRGK